MGRQKVEDYNNVMVKYVTEHIERDCDLFDLGNIILPVFVRSSVRDVKRRDRPFWEEGSCEKKCEFPAIDCIFCLPLSPLHFAMKHMHHGMVRLLLEEGFNPNALAIQTELWNHKDHQGVTALHIASVYNDINSAKVLLEFGARTDIRCKSRKYGASGTVLEWAATHCNFAMCKLFNPSFDVEGLRIPLDRFYRAMSHALERNDFNKLKDLIPLMWHGNVRDHDFHRFLWIDDSFWDVKKCVAPVLWQYLILVGGLNPNSTVVFTETNVYYTLLHTVVTNERAVRTLLDLGANPTLPGIDSHRYSGTALEWLRQSHSETPVRGFERIETMLIVKEMELSRLSLADLVKSYIRLRLRSYFLNDFQVELSIDSMKIPEDLRDSLKYKSF